jgi:LmbE family N-acetylglucosaminyl deacetylase
VSAWEGRQLLVVVAHPDDETFGCGSVIADAAAGGAHVTVCCATRGEAGELVDGCDVGGGSLAELRERELRTAAAALGAREVVLLDFHDSAMSGDAGHDTLHGAPFDSVVDAVAAVVVRTRPDVVVTLDPTGGDGHRDHVRISRATIEAVRRTGVAASVYCWCIPRSLLVAWLEHLHTIDPDAGHLRLDTTDLGRPDEDITTVVDVTAHLPRRRHAIGLHASQRSPYEGLPDTLAEEFLRTDRLVRVEPRWTGGATENALTIGRSDC